MTTQTLTTPQTIPAAASVAAPPTRSLADGFIAMPSAIRSEWIKVRTLRSNVAIAAMTAGVSGFATWAVAQFVTDPTTTMELFTFPTVFVAVFAATAGILMFASESEHGTLTPTMTGQPSRAVVAGSKAVVAASVGLLLTVISLGAAWIGSEVGGNPMGDTTGVWGDAGRAVLFGTMSATLGLGLGMITRQSAAAISGLLAWWLVVENLIQLFVSETYTRFMPFTAGNNMIGASDGPERLDTVSTVALSTVENGLVFGAYAVVAVLIGTVLLYARDDA